MSKPLSFNEIVDEQSSLDVRDRPEHGKAPYEVEVTVAGPRKSTEVKTVQFFTRDNGLVKAKFKEGGQLPRELSGMFTDIKSAASAVQAWMARAEKDAKLDDELHQELTRTEAPVTEKEEVVQVSVSEAEEVAADKAADVKPAVSVASGDKSKSSTKR